MHINLAISKVGSWKEKSEVLEAMEKAGKPVRPGDVAKLSGLPKDEVSKAIESLRKEGKITSPKRCFYAPAQRQLVRSSNLHSM